MKLQLLNVEDNFESKIARSNIYCHWKSCLIGGEQLDHNMTSTRLGSR